MCRVVRALLSVVVVAAVLFVIIAPAQATNYVNENNGHSIKLPSETIALTPLKIQQMKQKYHAFMERKGLPIPKPLKEDPNFLADLEIHEQAKKVQCTFHTVCNEFACTPVCEIGSVQIDSWLLNAMETQRNLQLDTPLNYLSLPGSHNAAITKATGVGIEEDWLNSILNPLDMWVYIANNQFSLTDQMNMGVRHLELDIHWFNGEIRICHAGGIHLQLLDELMKELGVDWDSETIGCFNPWGRTLNDTFVEINKWINKNPSEFLMFYFDDQYDLENWGKVPLLMEAIHYHFGDFVLTPMQKNSFFPNGWPTQRQLIRMGKQVLFASRSNYALQMNSSIFYAYYLWNEWTPDTFIAFPRCVVGGNSLLGNGTMERVLADSLIYGPFWNGYGGGVITQSVLEGMTNCGTNFMSSDQVSPILMEGAVWSWDKGEPSNMKNGCVAMGSDGRWKLQDCNTVLPYVCQKIGTLLDYTISTTKGPWTKASCPPGYQFAVPTNGLVNTRLNVKSNGANLWVNFTV